MSWMYRLVLFLFLFSCSLENSNQDALTGISYEVVFGNTKFQADFGRYQKMNFERGSNSSCNSPIYIAGMKRTGDLLTLQVRRNGNCQGGYRLVWDGMVLERNPERVQLYFYPEFTGCSVTGEEVVEEITIDLKRAFVSLKPEVVGRMYLYVREYCNFVDYLCEGNCDLKKFETD
jgi:hypothetical protein